jgi:hypothetical protein
MFRLYQVEWPVLLNSNSATNYLRLIQRNFQSPIIRDISQEPDNRPRGRWREWQQTIDVVNYDRRPSSKDVMPAFLFMALRVNRCRH